MAEQTIKSSTISKRDMIDSLFDRGEELIERLGCQVFILVSQDGIWSSYMGSEVFLKEFRSSGLKIKSQDVLRTKQQDFHFVEDAGCSQQILYSTQQRTYHINNIKSSKLENVEKPPCLCDTLARASNNENMTRDCCIVTNTMNSCVETNCQNDEKDVKREQTEEIQMECFSKEKLVKESYLEIGDEGETATIITIETEAKKETPDTETIPYMADEAMSLANVDGGNVSLLPGNHGCNEEKREKSPDDHARRVFENAEIKTKDANIESEEGAVDNPDKSKLGESIKANAAHRHHLGKNYSEEDFRLHKEKIETMFKESNESKPHLCERCGLSLKDLNGLEVHQQKALCSERKCQFCGMCFPIRAWQEHLLENHVAKVTIYGCHICERKFICYHSHRDHLKVHESERNSLICNVCGETFNRFSTLKLHQLAHKGTELKCEYCEYTTFVKHRLNSHMKRHFERGKFECKFCGKHLNSGVCLSSHIRRFHIKSKHQCSDCKKEFSFLRELNNHRARHHQDNVASFICEKCGKGFLSKILLNLHLKKTHSDYSVQCEVCGKQFKHQSKLQTHLKFHNKSINQLHRCELCPRKFTTISKVKIHMRSAHSFERPYQCQFCEYSCKLKGNLTKHIIRIHNKK
ncbi:oocyte zinc finger protein XlCOF22-like [Ptychodera flava]|uniref:oocyte zinc finger protein XlCOF22-like n=1 Tax=Ptychodera flava TaxID=63121 RepID=UPI00396A2099